jgi:glucokinase
MYLLFDIGGTHVRIGYSTDGKTLVTHRRINTPTTYQETLQEIEAAAHEWAAESNGAKWIAAGGGLPGIMNEQGTGLQAAPHLPSEWTEKNIKADLERLLTCPVTLANDTLMIGMGEAHAGAGMGHAIVAFLAIGTGVGGCRIVNGKPDEFSVGFEPGHQLITVAEHIDAPDTTSEWEQLVSGSGIKASTGKKPNEVQDPQFWDQVAEYVAIGLLNTASYWSPDIIVIGGGLILRDYIPWDRVEHYYNAVETVIPKPEITKARLADAGGLIGALKIIAD